MTTLLRRWADAALCAENDRLQTELRKRDATIDVLETERDALAAVVARDRSRIMAECAAYARQRANAEGLNDDGISR